MPTRQEVHHGRRKPRTQTAPAAIPVYNGIGVVRPCVFRVRTIPAAGCQRKCGSGRRRWMCDIDTRRGPSGNQEVARLVRFELTTSAFAGLRSIR